MYFLSQLRELSSFDTLLVTLSVTSKQIVVPKVVFVRLIAVLI